MYWAMMGIFVILSGLAIACFLPLLLIPAMAVFVAALLVDDRHSRG